MEKSWIRLLALILACVAILSICRADELATVTGLVTDSSGRSVPGVKVAVVNLSTNVTSNTTTNEQGLYRVPSLLPGIYRITLLKDGFKSVVKSGIELHIQDVASINFELELGSVTETVTVQAGAPLLNTESITLGHVVDEREVINLPLVSRNYTQILALSPGVAADVTNASQLGRNSQDVYVNGMGDTGSNFQMDGIEINNFGSNRAGETYGGLYGGIAIPNPDAIQEFNVQTSLYDAGSGRAVGANVNVVTKSGTNSYHGNVFEFLRNDALNANDYFSNLNGQARPVLKQNQFGGTFGGPIRKNKLFFFGSYQGTRQVNGVGSNGHASAVLPPLTDDRSAATLGAQFCGQSGTFGGVAVACDGSNINPVALKILNYKFANGQYLIPTPQTIEPNGSGFSVFSVPARATENQYLINSDYILSSRHTLSERVFVSGSPESLPFFGGANIPGLNYTANLQNRNVALKLSSAISSTLFNELSFGFVRNLGNVQSASPLLSSDFGITPGNPTVPGLMGIQIGGIGINTGTGSAGKTVNNNFPLADQISWQHGRHSIRAGFQLERIEYNFDLNAAKAGLIDILSFPDFLLGQSAAQNGSQFSNVFSDSTFSGDESRQMRGTNWAAYVQDDIKVNSRLTLNAGLRWEIFGGVYDARGRASNFWPQLANNDFTQGPNYTGFVAPANYVGTLPPGVVRNDNKTCCANATPQNWGPRVGLAWQPLPSTDKLVFRAGYGIFYSRPPGNVVGPVLVSIPPFAEAIFQSGAASAAATLQQPFNPAPIPDSAFPIWLPRSPDALLSNNNVSASLTSPFVQMFSANLQEEFLPNFLLEVGYVGTRGTRLNQFFPFDQAQLASPADPINGITTNTVANAYLRVPVIGFTPTAGQQDSYGFSWYNALQVNLRKRFSRGLEFQASYTYDRSLDDVSSSIGQNGTQGGYYSGDAHDRQLEWGPSDFDRPQRFVFSYVWEIPAYKEQQQLAGKLLGGWQVSGVVTIQAGHLLTVADARSGTIYGGALFGGASRAELCPGETNADIPTTGSITSRLNNYINAAVFCAPPAIGDGSGFGNLRRGVFSGPPQDNFDFAVVKQTVVGGLSENANVEFRAEFFNIFNHPQFADPNSGCFFGCGVGVPGFNQLTSTSVAPRIVQFALKYNF